MADQELIQLVKSIKDSELASIKLSTTSGFDVYLDCIYKESIAPNFFVVFPPGKIPKDLDAMKPCTLSFHDESGSAPALNATIKEITSDRSIELTATQTVDPTSLREYFRVDINTKITLTYEGDSGNGKSRSWVLQGKTLDLSGSGVLGLFSEEPRNRHNIFLEILLTHPEKPISCVGRVVRTKRLRGGKWLVAMHFVNITQKNRDSLITNCLWEQRRQLRERIQTI